MFTTRSALWPSHGDIQARLRALLVVLTAVVAVAGVAVPAASAGTAAGVQNGVAAINPGSGSAVAATPAVSPALVGVSGLLFDNGAVVSLVTPGGLADDGARFVVDSAGTTTLRAKGPQGWINVSEHAAQRMTQRGISIDAVDTALATQSFRYFHDGVWKTGYYDAGSKVFVGTVIGTATTVIKTGQNYINNLKAAGP